MRTFLLLFLLAPLAAQAQIYRWTDASGTVHYGQSPPPGGDYKRMRRYEDAATGRSGIGGTSKGAASYLSQAAKADSADEQARRAAVQAKAERAERCAKAREKIAELEQKTAHRILVKGADGETSRMTDEQYDKLIGDARKQAQDSCSG